MGVRFSTEENCRGLTEYEIKKTERFLNKILQTLSVIHEKKHQRKSHSILLVPRKRRPLTWRS